MSGRLKLYYRLAKPGIIYGNALTAAGGFLLASKGHVLFGDFLAMLVGLSLVIGSGCVANNYFDRDIDKLMNRTKKRALAAGAVNSTAAIIYSLLLGTAGLLILGIYTNRWTTWLALFGLAIYVFAYTPAKRKTVHATLIGAMAGAVPPAIGYCAASGRFDLAAGLLILILIFWQMPHFYAISIYRKQDYATAKLPVLPVVKGNRAAKLQIAGYIAAFLASAVMLSLNGYTGIIYLVVIATASLVWLRTALQGFAVSKDGPWARRTFLQSLVVISLFSLFIGLDNWLP